jgi:putative peptide zinc metalloprotease protein
MLTLYRQYWYRIAPLRPRLRSHMEIHRHHYRGKLWYVLQNHSSQEQYRFSPAAHALIARMDGRRTVQEIWELTESSLGDRAPTQDDVVQMLALLHAADALQCDITPDVEELLMRHRARSRQQWQKQLLSPLCWRIPLMDPDRVLERLLPYVRPLLGWTGATLWLAVVGMAALQAGAHWTELTHNVADRIQTAQNLFLLWLTFPLIKILHELGHALVTKAYGGEVHEMGVLLVALQPVPYVDASAASTFRSKRQRILVGAAGMIVELFIASIALFLWLNLESGVLRAVAYNVIFIAGISTVLFNANPLLRYDGYYMLMDYLEMPNLGTRAHAYMVYLCERYLFGRRDARAESATPAERVWLILYPIAAFFYRAFVLASVTLFLAGKFFFIGVLLALAGIAAGVLVPLVRMIAYLFTSPRIRSVRRRATVASALIASLALALICMPLPLRTRAEGVVWLPEHGRLRAGVDGFVERIVAQPGSFVQRGEVLIVCRDPELTARVKVLESRLAELQTRYMAQWLLDFRQAQIVKDEIVHIEEQVARAREHVAELVIRSRSDGVFEVPDAASLPGRFIRQGTPLAYVLDPKPLTARVVIPETEIELVRYHTRQVQVRPVGRPTQSFTTSVQREVPAVTEQLPSTALGSHGGGTIAVDPRDSKGIKSIEKVFQLDLTLPPDTGIDTFGGRVYVRFDHGWEPLVSRWHRQVRRLFLSKFNV